MKILHGQIAARRGFTLIELLIVMGIVGSLSAVVILAVNPAGMLGQSQDAKRNSSANQIQKAMQQYLIEQGRYPDEANIPTSEASAKPICADDYIGASCISMAPALIPTYIASLPEDQYEKCSAFSGFKVYLKNGRAQVLASHVGLRPEQISMDATCPSAVPADITASVANGGAVTLNGTQNVAATPVTVTISNGGTVALTLSSITVTRTSGNFSTAFDGGAFEGQPSLTVPGGGTKNLTLTLDTGSVGAVAGQVSFATSDLDTPSFSFTVNGTVNPPATPDIALFDGATSAGTPITDGQAGAIDFGSTTQGTPVDRTFTIRNEGTAPISLTLPLTVSGDFSIFTQPSSSTVNVNQELTFVVRLAATSVGSPAGTVTVTSDDPDAEGTFTFPVSGTVTSGIPAGLVAWWKLDETVAGSALADSTGNGHAGTPAGATAPGTSVPPPLTTSVRSLYFTGGSASTPDANDLDGSATMSFSFWVYPTTLDGNPRGILSKRVAPGSNPSYSFFFYTGNRLYLDLDNANDRTSSNTVFSANQWYHVAVTYDGSQLAAQRAKLYVNGVLDKTFTETSASIPNYASSLWLGILNTGASHTYAGRLDDVRIYSRTLTAQEVAALYAGP